MNIDNFCQKTCALTPCQESDIFLWPLDSKDISPFHCDTRHHCQQKLYELLQYLFINEFESGLQNGGTCFDNGGTQEFSCSCVGNFAGNECQIDLCDNIDCQNGGTCVIKVFDGIRTTSCDCPPNFGGKTCIPISPCDGNPCQNGGTCISKNQGVETQVCFVINLEWLHRCW